MNKELGAAVLVGADVTAGIWLVICAQHTCGNDKETG